LLIANALLLFFCIVEFRYAPYATIYPCVDNRTDSIAELLLDSVSNRFDVHQTILRLDLDAKLLLVGLAFLFEVKK
jgi:hypothetical protein